MAFKVLGGMDQCLQRRVFLFPTLKVYSQICRDQANLPCHQQKELYFYLVHILHFQANHFIFCKFAYL